MMENVVITLKSVQGIGENEETVELTTLGRYGLNGQEALITYDESALLEAKNVKTFLHCHLPDTVILKRTGDVEARLVIEKDKTNLCRYNIGVGEMLLDITGERIEATLSSTGGEIKLEYRIDVADKPLTRNKIEITIRKA